MDNSQSLPYPYLWAVGAAAKELTARELINDRYKIIAPQIWQDTQPQQPPQKVETLPELVSKYLQLFTHQLHIPIVYDICLIQEEEIILLDNVPLDQSGHLYPSLEEAWQNGSSLEQVYWFWQILQLWQPLQNYKVGASLIVADNLRVENWRLRLKELIPGNATLAELGASWTALATEAQHKVASLLVQIATQLQGKEPSFASISLAFNEFLVEISNKNKLQLEVGGMSHLGRVETHNEDSYYPHPEEIENSLASHLTMIADGVREQEGGEVASNLAVESLKLLIPPFLQEIKDKTISPQMVFNRLKAIIRIVNNLICSRNDQQERELRRRMATTVVMAVRHGRQLYLAHVGDSRAYWLTGDHCLQLTIDDTMANREVKEGGSTYRQALQHKKGMALTQAIGMKPGTLLQPTVNRLIIVEDGILLLCSHGLSDGNFLERQGRDFAGDILAGKVTVEQGVKKLLQLANQENGRDNISIVATAYFNRQ